MGGSLNQPCRVQEEGSMDCKLLLYRKKWSLERDFDGTVRIRIG